MKPQQIKVINKLTGEVWELEYSTLQEALDAYLIVKGMSDALDRAKGKLTAFLGSLVEDKQSFDNGYSGQWIQASRKRYRPEVVSKYLSPDQLSVVTEINSTKLKDLFALLVDTNQGIPGAWEDIEANAEITPAKSYFVIKRSL